MDPQAGTMVFEEVGPSGVEDAAPTVTRHRIAVLSSTMFVRARRVAGPGPAGWSGDFVEELVESWSVEQGDFVTILCLHEGRFLTALEIIVTVVDR